MCKSYDCSPHSKRVCDATDSTAVSQCGREVKPPPGNWKVLTTDKWVLDTVQGLRIPFVNLPVQVNCPNPPMYSKEQSLLLQEEVGALLEKGAVVKVLNPQHQERFYSTLFLVPRKGGQMRPVINLKRLNEWVEPQHFKMKGMGTLKELLRVNDWMVNKDAYFTVPIHPDHQPFLHFQVGPANYQFTCLPFGLSCAPWIFTKVMKPITISKYGGLHDRLYR